MAFSSRRADAQRQEAELRQSIKEQRKAAASQSAVSPANDAESKLRKRKRDRLDPRKVRIGGKTFWQVNLGSEVRNAKRYRLRRTFASEKEAQTFAQLRRVERINHGAAGVALSDRLRGEAVEAAQLLEPYGASLLDAVREYVERRERISKSETVTNGLTEFLAAKTGDNMRPRYLEDLRSRLGRFSKSFGERKLADIQPNEIDGWLRDLHQAPLSRNTFLLRLNTFFEFVRQRGWVEANPLKDVPRAKVSPSAIGIFSVEQSARLLESASEETLPYLAIGLFCGLRSGELERLEWADVHFDEKLVEVPSLKSKTASRRFVTIQPNLALWLEPYRLRLGKICPSGLYERLREDRRRAGILQWPANGLRHSFASYHLARFRDPKELALEMGHSRSEITFRFYRELIKPSQAEKFWRLAPTVRGATITAVA